MSAVWGPKLSELRDAVFSSQDCREFECLKEMEGMKDKQ